MLGDLEAAVWDREGTKWAMDFLMAALSNSKARRGLRSYLPPAASS